MLELTPLGVIAYVPGASPAGQVTPSPGPKELAVEVLETVTPPGIALAKVWPAGNERDTVKRPVKLGSDCTFAVVPVNRFCFTPSSAVTTIASLVIVTVPET